MMMMMQMAVKSPPPPSPLPLPPPSGLLDIYKIYKFSTSLPRFIGIMSENPSSPLSHRFLKDFERLNTHFSKFQEFVECVIDMRNLPDLTISPAHDPKLAEIREEMDGVEEEIERLYERAKVGSAVEWSLLLLLLLLPPTTTTTTTTI